MVRIMKEWNGLSHVLTMPFQEGRLGNNRNKVNNHPSKWGGLTLIVDSPFASLQDFSFCNYFERSRSSYDQTQESTRTHRIPQVQSFSLQLSSKCTFVEGNSNSRWVILGIGNGKSWWFETTITFHSNPSYSYENPRWLQRYAIFDIFETIFKSEEKWKRSETEKSKWRWLKW